MHGFKFLFFLGLQSSNVILLCLYKYKTMYFNKHSSLINDKFKKYFFFLLEFSFIFCLFINFLLFHILFLQLNLFKALCGNFLFLVIIFQTFLGFFIFLHLAKIIVHHYTFQSFIEGLVPRKHKSNCSKNQ